MARITRRQALKAAGGSLALPLVGASSAQTTSGDAWPTFSYDTRNSGHSPTSGPKQAVSARWSFEAGGPIRSSPVVAGGRVYVGSDDGHLYAIEQEQGEQAWAFETGDSIAGAPAVIDGTVYIGSTDGTLYALDVATGEEQWSFETQGPIGASPTVSAGTVYVGSDDAHLYAIDAASGTESWTVETGSLVTSTPAVVEDTVFFGSADDSVYAVSTSGGDQPWTVTTGNGVNSSPAVVDGTVYVSSNDGYLYALAKQSGEQQWTFALDGLGGTSPAVSDGQVYISEGASGSRIHSLDAATGERLWTGQTGDSVRSSIAVADGVAYVGSSDTAVYAVETTEGQLLWRFRTDGAVTSSPAVVGDTVYIGSHDGHLYALTGAVERTTTQNQSAASGSASTAGPNSPPDTNSPDSDASGSGGSFPIVPAVLAAGVGGGGALWMYRRRSKPDTEPASTPPEPASESSEPATEAAAPPAADDTEATTIDIESWVGEADRREPTDIPTTQSFELSFSDITEQAQLSESETAEVTKAVAATPRGEIPIALRTPRFTGTIHNEEIEQWLTEADTWSKLDDHDHIVTVVAYGGEPLPWLAMEYMDGGSLTEQREDMPPVQKLWTALAITKGIYHAHRRGVAHLGIDPESILFRTSADGWPVPKVSSWGFDVTQPDSRTDESARDAAGLTPYTAPEQVDASYGTPDDVTDVYRLGAVLYELFTGQPPIDADDSETNLRAAILDGDPVPPSERADVPAALDDVLLPALAPSKDDRYDSLVYLRDALEDLYQE